MDNKIIEKVNEQIQTFGIDTNEGINSVLEDLKILANPQRGTPPDFSKAYDRARAFFTHDFIECIDLPHKIKQLAFKMRTVYGEPIQEVEDIIDLCNKLENPSINE